MTDVLPWLGPIEDKHRPRAFDEQRLKKGLKNSLVVVELNAVGRV